MSDPATGGAAGIAGHKAFMLGMPIAITLLAWWLGMRIFPPRKGREFKDMLDRLVACAVSSFLVGVPLLVALLNHMPWVFSTAADLAGRAGLEPITGFFAIVGCVLLLASLPGPWLVVAYLRWFHRRRGKDIGEMFGDAADDIRRVSLDNEDSGRGGL